MDDRMRQGLMNVLLAAIAENGGELILSGRNREMLSGRGLTRRDINAVVGDLVHDGRIKIETEGGAFALIADSERGGGN